MRVLVRVLLALVMCLAWARPAHAMPALVTAFVTVQTGPFCRCGPHCFDNFRFEAGHVVCCKGTLVFQHCDAGHTTTIGSCHFWVPVCCPICPCSPALRFKMSAIPGTCTFTVDTAQFVCPDPCCPPPGSCVTDVVFPEDITGNACCPLVPICAGLCPSFNGFCGFPESTEKVRVVICADKNHPTWCCVTVAVWPGPATGFHPLGGDVMTFDGGDRSQGRIGIIYSALSAPEVDSPEAVAPLACLGGVLLLLESRRRR